MRRFLLYRERHIAECCAVGVVRKKMAAESPWQGSCEKIVVAT
jgi:hypothetical protein